MLPVIVLVGRPNVGKSTLFNRLTRSRDALVADQPGLTRDRKYGTGKLGDRPYVVVDTGGISGAAEGIDLLMEQQVRQAIGEADHILFLLDAKQGCTGGDEIIADQLRRTGKPVTPVVNKSDGMDAQLATVDFFKLGLGEPAAIAAAHGRGVRSLIDRLLADLPEGESEPDAARMGTFIAVVGRPNVGKSTLVNRLLGEERVVVYDQPGTTRDSVYIPFERHGGRYTLIDTAGIRRRGRVSEAIEKFSVIKALKAIEKAHVVIYLVDAREGVTDQDANLLGMVLEIGRGLIIGLNKWDGLDPAQKDQVRRQIDVKLPFVDFAEKHFISALHGTGVGHLLDEVREVYASAMREMSASHLTRLLHDVVARHQPPLVRGRRIRLKYAHPGGHNPPTVVIHGNQVDEVPGSYKRYLMNAFREALALHGTPIRLEFRGGDNPYEGKRNPLTPRQVRKRRRLMKHVK